MKKIFVLSLLILAFAVTAYSQPKLDFRASGFFSVTTQWWRWNTTTNIENSQGFVDVLPAHIKPGFPGGGDFNKTAAYVEQRGRLKFDAIMGKELSGTIFFEMDSRTWGDDTGGSRNQIGSWQADRAGVEIKNLYFDIAVPYIPVPITVRPGVQPFGIRSPMFWYTDGTGITAAAKLDPFTIIGMWGKAIEGRIASSDDIDFYGLHANMKVNTFTLGGYGVYFNARQYPLNSIQNTTALGAANSMNANMWWLGLYADGKLGPVMINFDAIYNNGEVKDRSHGFGTVDYSGYAGYLKVNFPWEAFNFGVVGVYGSGADARKTGKLGVPGAPVSDPNYADAGALTSKVGSYAIPMGSETGMQESEVLFASYLSGGFNGWAYTQDGTRFNRGSVGGLWFAKLYGSWKLTPEFKMTLQGLYIGDTTKNGDTLGNSRGASGGLKNNSAIGWEIDLINEWQVYKNLSFNFGGGLLFPLDGLKFFDPTTGGNEKPDTPWTFITKLTYSF